MQAKNNDRNDSVGSCGDVRTSMQETKAARRFKLLALFASLLLPASLGCLTSEDVRSLVVGAVLLIAAVVCLVLALKTSGDEASGGGPSDMLHRWFLRKSDRWSRFLWGKKHWTSGQYESEDLVVIFPQDRSEAGDAVVHAGKEVGAKAIGFPLKGGEINDHLPELQGRFKCSWGVVFVDDGLAMLPRTRNRWNMNIKPVSQDCPTPRPPLWAGASFSPCAPSRMLAAQRHVLRVAGEYWCGPYDASLLPARPFRSRTCASLGTGTTC